MRVCVCVRAMFCACESMRIEQKRGPNSRLVLNLIPGHPFTIFSISLYDDIRRKEARVKGICEFFVPIEHLLRPLVCGYPRGIGKGL